MSLAIVHGVFRFSTLPCARYEQAPLLGGGESMLQSAINNLTSNATNLSDARSRIMDTDYSAETTALAKAQILSQASTAMIAQSNQAQQNVLTLLR